MIYPVKFKMPKPNILYKGEGFMQEMIKNNNENKEKNIVKKQARQEIYMEYMICQVEHGNTWQTV